jgi:hypothetical protein
VQGAQGAAFRIGEGSRERVQSVGEALGEGFRGRYPFAGMLLAI